jgi:hypothetical protein
MRSLHGGAKTSVRDLLRIASTQGAHMHRAMRVGASAVRPRDRKTFVLMRHIRLIRPT